MKAMQVRAIKALLAEAGFRPGDALVVGVSGGPDSLALLYQLREAVPAATLHVAHLDHRLRPASAADAGFVQRTAEELGLAFHGSAVDVAEHARQNGQSIEEAGREARYAFLAAVARELGATVVAVGHHAEDQAETVLLHFLRGAGLTGLRGMQKVAPLPGAAELRLIRPLLGQTRAEIEAYIEQLGLVPLDDESNRDTGFARNRLRHELLPELAAYNPQIVRHLNRLATIAAGEDRYLEQQLDAVWPELVVQIGPGWLCLDRGGWQALPLALQRRVVRRAVFTLNEDTEDLSFRAVEQAVDIARRNRAGMETLLPGGITLLADYERLLFGAGDSVVPSDLPQLPDGAQRELPVPGVVELANEWVISAEPVETPLGINLVSQDPWQTLLALPEEAALVVRQRVPGERMQPLGMDGRSASLQDIMVNRKLAARLRDQWPLVTADDQVLWLVGHVLDHRARVTDGARRVVRLRCTRRGMKHD
ncbi:MAG: tRNA lysidine(34) synthetase TilS [Candidatus Promineifilaceae bacterium]